MRDALSGLRTMKGRVLAAFLAGILLGLLALLTPPAAGAASGGFSATRAKADVDVLARAPHSVWNQGSLIPVRDHIRKRLEGMGLAVTTRSYPEVMDIYGHHYPLENLSASLPGRTGSSVLLVSHYDASPKKRSAEDDGSRGAADDGYGVATMLELADRLRREPRENGVRFLFTDAEETGLWGARAEMKWNRAAYDDVNLVINLEARGVKGPAVMFETGRDNAATLRLFRKAHWAFAYSFAVDVYRRMPNGTDFSVFNKAGFPGLNFAVLDDLSYYHTARDNPANVSLGSLQHYGEQVLPVVRAYAGDARYAGKDAFRAKEDMVYFNWLPGVFLSWTTFWDRVLGVLLAAAFLAWAGRMLARGRARLVPSLLWGLAWAGVAAGALALGLGTSFLASKVTGIRWLPTYMPNVPHERLLTWALVLGLGYVCQRLARRARGDRAPLLGAMALNLVLLAVMTVYLPGGTFLFSMPLLAGLGAVVLADLTGRPVLALAGVVLAVSLFVPVLHLFALALTFGALGLVLLLAAFPLALAGALAAEGPGGNL